SYLQADDKGAAEKELDNFMERVEKNNLFNESAQLSNAYVVAGEIKGRLKSEGVMNALIRPDAQGNLIGNVVYTNEKGKVSVAQLKGKFDAENNNLVLTNVDSKDDREIVIPVKGEKGKQALENAVMFAEESMSVNNDLLTNESDIIKQINVFVGQKDITIYTLGLSLDSIMGFANREKEVFIAESLLNYGDREVQAIAVFNQVGEAYFAKREDELPEGVNSYIYMSGCGEDVREAVTEIVNISEIKEAQEFVDAINIHLPGERKLSVSETALIRHNWGNVEKADMSILGLQDRLFGSQANENFTQAIKSISAAQKPEIMPEHVANPPTEKIQSLRIEKIELNPSQKMAIELNKLLSGNMMGTPKVDNMMKSMEVMSKAETML
ncbi:MAG: hypothetical protein KAS13_04530, partial [Candidatus Omnitrophica bacterium]|nr:hypothetical protein [Candidatus Omnitrophota bacterium]